MRKFLLLLAIITLSGCASSGVLPSPKQEFENASASIKAKKYPAAIAAYKRIITGAPDSALSANALFELGLAHAHYDNPHRDYAQAAQAFEEFSNRHPDDKRTAGLKIMIHLLKTVMELKKQNEQLNKNIQQLKRLDIRHEERRRRE